MIRPALALRRSASPRSSCRARSPRCCRRRSCPTSALLVTVIAAVEAPALLALALAAGLGYGTDYLSGTLLGEAALLAHPRVRGARAS